MPDRPRAPDPAGSDRRRFLSGALTGVAALLAPLPALAATIVGVRVWPSRDYTRVTLELDAPLAGTLTVVADPPRVVVDLDGIDLDDKLRDLVAKVRPDDPYIRQVRVGQFKPRVVRLVFDLKSETAPQLFPLAPVGSYRHRLLLDLHPTVPIDPLQSLLAEAPSRLPPPFEDPIAPLLRESSGDGLPQAVPAPLPGGRPKPVAPATPTLRKPATPRLVTIALDPGHGGEDPGAIGREGTREKDVVLSIGKMLRERINAEPNMRAFMTRDSDFFVPLATRVQKARQAQSDLFVSIHADAFVNPLARGASVYVLSEDRASSSAASWLARRENGADLIGGVNLGGRNRDVAKVLLELSTSATLRDSGNLGRIVLGQLGTVGSLHKPQVEKAGFAVLKAPDIPSILVETAFISNPEEERRLGDLGYQQRIAEAIFRGLRQYLIRFPPPARSVPM
jgi:N-acetylmuramoyl-L-alanine amidase